MVTIVLTPLISKDTFAQTGTYSCYTQNDDGGSTQNTYRILNLDCGDGVTTTSWYWNNGSNLRQPDNIMMNCSDTFSAYVASLCPGGAVENVDTLFCSDHANYFNANAFFSCNAPTTNYIDIGLRIKQADGTVAHIAIEPTTAQTSPLKIAKNGVKYTVALVPINDVNATKARVNTPTGIKALRICTLANGCAYQP